MRIQADQSFAIIVDCQERLLPVMQEKEALLQNLITLVKGLKLHDIPLIVPEQYSKGLGKTVAPLAEALGDFTPYEKSDFSAYSSDIKAPIDALGRKTAIVCGIEAHVCVLQTVIDLRAAGYTVFLVQDCVSSRRHSDKDAAILRAVAEGAFITTYEALLFELTVGKSNPNFKSISNLVK